MTQPRLSRRTFTTLTVGVGVASAWAPAFAQDRLTVSAVNYPLAYFAERIAGDLAEVSFPVPAGIDPSFWRPSIGDISTFQNSDLILLNGAGFADWTGRVTLPRSRLVNTSAAFEGSYIATETVTHSHGDGGEHSHTGTASYTWLDFSQAAQQAAAISAAMTRRIPDSEPLFSANLATLADELFALDGLAREVGALSAGTVVIASHPRYQYFARAYGLDVRSLDWDPNEDPVDAQWQALDALVAETQAAVFLWEAVPSDTALSRMAQTGLTSAVFAPLANRPENGDFISHMGRTIENLRDAFSAASTN